MIGQALFGAAMVTALLGLFVYVVSGAAHRSAHPDRAGQGNPPAKTEDFPMSASGWIGVDLDGTLARYDGWKGIAHIGAPIPAMLERVKRWRADGVDVRIFTARVDGGQVAIAMGEDAGTAATEVAAVRHHIEQWCLTHLGEVLPITNVKDFGMVELWDDRAVQVEFNTGRRMDGRPEGPVTP